MTDTIWIDRDSQLDAVAQELERADWIGIDTEFMRERTFFPKLCLLQISAPGRIWCVDTLNVAALSPLLPAFTAAAPKILHAARQDLEAIYLVARTVVAPVFDTQIAAACVGMKPQLGYADLAKTLLNVSIAKSQTRTDWSRRPLSDAQMVYAAEDVRHLNDIAVRLRAQLAELGREQWAREDCELLANARLYDLDPERAWMRIKGISQLAPGPAAIARALAVWRERLARERDLPRAWILSDPAIFNLAHAAPTSIAALINSAPEAQDIPAQAAASLLETIGNAGPDSAPVPTTLQDLRPTAEQKSTISRLGQLVDRRAAELNVSPELLATRGEIKSLVMNKDASDPAISAETACMRGWRREQIGERLLEELGKA